MKVVSLLPVHLVPCRIIPQLTIMLALFSACLLLGHLLGASASLLSPAVDDNLGHHTNQAGPKLPAPFMPIRDSPRSSIHSQACTEGKCLGSNHIKNGGSSFTESRKAPRLQKRLIGDPEATWKNYEQGLKASGNQDRFDNTQLSVFAHQVQKFNHPREKEPIENTFHTANPSRLLHRMNSAPFDASEQFKYHKSYPFHKTYSLSEHIGAYMGGPFALGNPATYQHRRPGIIPEKTKSGGVKKEAQVQPGGGPSNSPPLSRIRPGGGPTERQLQQGHGHAQHG